MNSPRLVRFAAMTCLAALAACSGGRGAKKAAAVATPQPAQVDAVQASPAPLPVEPRVAARDALLAALDDPCVEVRSAALDALAAAGEKVRGEAAGKVLAFYHDGKMFGPRLVKAAAAVGAVTLEDMKPLLDEKDPEVRRRALLTLCALGPDVPAALPLLEKAAAAPGACSGWESWGPLLEAMRCVGPGALPLLLSLVAGRDVDDLLFKDAMKLLREMGPAARAALPDLVKLYGEKVKPATGSAVCRELPEAIGAVAPGDPETIALFEKELGSPDKNIRENAARGLAAMGEKALPALPALVKAMDDPYSYFDTGEASGNKVYPVRGAAARALGAIGPAAKAAVPVLVRDLKMKKLSGYTAEDIRAGLAGIGSAAVPALKKLLASKQRKDRENAAEVLAAMGPGGIDAVPAIIKTLKAGDSTAVAAVAAMAPQAVGAVPALVALLEGNSCSSEVLEAVGEYHAEARAAVPVLVAALSSDDEYCFEDVVKTLADIGPGAKDAAPKLVELLANAEVASYAAKALAAVGDGGAAVLAALGEALRTSDSPDVRQAAAHAVGKLGAGGEAQAASILEMVRAGGSTCAVFEMYVKGRAEAGEAGGVALVPLLVKTLQDPDGARRACAASSLGAVGPAAADALAPLAALLAAGEGECELRRGVAASLGSILAPPPPAAPGA